MDHKSRLRLQALERARQTEALTPEEREVWLSLGDDLERAWNHDKATPEFCKRILRAVLVETTAAIRDRENHLLLQWEGGDHTELVVRRAVAQAGIGCRSMRKPAA